MTGLAAVLERIDRTAAAPAVALLQRTPPAFEARVPLIRREQLDALLPSAALGPVDELLALDGGVEEARGSLRTVAGSAPRRPPWFALDAHRAWLRLEAAMRADLGRAAQAASAYRSPVYQAMLLLWLLDRDADASVVARFAHSPARSEHCCPALHAVDVVAPGAGGLQSAFAASEEYLWLREYAGAYGFSESFCDPNGATAPEPWHWRYHP